MKKEEGGEMGQQLFKGGRRDFKTKGKEHSKCA